MNPLPPDEQDDLVLNHFPYPIAVAYQKALTVETASGRFLSMTSVFTNIVRAFALVVTSNYLPIGDQLKHERFNKLLLDSLPKDISMGKWIDLLFTGVAAFEGKRNKFFVKELLDFCQQKGIRGRFESVTTIRNKTIHKVTPESEGQWKDIEQQIMSPFREILAQMDFVRNYNLILTLNDTESGMTYELWRGQHIDSTRPPLKSAILKPDKYYLTRDFESFLELHPMIIPQDLLNTEIQGVNVGLYESFTTSQVTYIILPAQGEAGSPSSLNDIQAIYFRLERQMKPQVRNASQLSWEQLREIAKEINDFRANKAYIEFQDESKHHLFLRRQLILDHFERFLASSSRTLVLIGKSGIGKSSILADIAYQYGQQSDYSVLIYDGARLSGKGSILKELASDLSRSLNTELNADSVIRALENIPRTDNQRFILILDAINECGDPAPLVAELDNLFVPRSNWLKIVISSRPQPWYEIKRRLELHENLYYKLTEQGEIELEVTEFSFDELREAFQRYKTSYKVQSEFSELSPLMARLLRDPLTLALICHIYQGKKLPQTFQPSQIYRRYIDRLIEDKRLRDKDIRFLQQWLMPLFIKEISTDSIRYAFPTATLSEIRDDRGVKLSEYILYEDQVAGEPLNLIYHNLASAGILAIGGTSIDEELSFRYERFWEYFGGLRLRELITDPVADYMKAAEAAGTKPFVRGIIRSALTEHLGSLDGTVRANVVYALADNDQTRDITEDALSIIGDEKSFDLEPLLEALLKSADQTASENQESRELPRKQVAIALASRFKFPKILEMAATDASPNVRVVALFGIVQYWYDSPELGSKFLKNLADKAVNRLGLPVSRYFEPLMGVSLFILFKDYRSPEATSQLAAIWRPLMEKVFHFNSNPQSALAKRLERAKSILRRQIINLGISFVLRLVGGEVDENNALSAVELNAFFKDKGAKERQRQVAEIIRFFNVEHTDIADIEPHLKAVASSHYIFTTWLTIIAIEAHLRVSPEKCLDLAETLFEEASKYEPLGPLYGYAPFWIMAMATHPVLGNPNPAYLERYAAMLKKMWVRTGGWYTTATGKLRMLYAGDVIRTENGSLEQGLSPSVREYLRQAVENADYDSMRYYVLECIRMIQLEGERVANIVFDVVEMLEPATNIRNPPDKAVELRGMLIEVLRFFRVFHPNKVDDFLSKSDLPLEFIRQITNQVARVKTTDLWSAQGLYFWETAIVRTDSRDLWRKAHWLFSTIPTCNSLSELVSLLLRLAVNVTYGDAIFPEIDEMIARFIRQNYDTTNATQ
jgi:hypothetical protein